MFGVVLQYLSHSNGLNDLVKRDILLSHLLVRMLGDTDVLRHSLRLNTPSMVGKSVTLGSLIPYKQS